MELGMLVTGGSIFVLAYALRVWWCDGRTWKPFRRRVCQRIRSALGVASHEEMSAIQKLFLEREQQWEARLTKLERTTKFSNQQQDVYHSIEQRLTQLELSEAPAKASESWPVQQPKSLVRFGVLVTISDALWTHLGMERANEIEDQFIESLIQGPFCPVCLKRLVGRDRSKTTEVPTQCRHCGATWSDQGVLRFPCSSLELKRQIYDQLDHEYRVG